ncbi:phosphatidylserine decarboxylase [Bacillus mojavensis]|uniref:phosphatidylserine decarboxylase n=1 Tax=Bacillus mojavensis TaxID=72360 RepID=UPI002DBEA0F2|nr:phosphatidylserine decarboxylase [Bacillus mojavensis]MEC1622289.1 phosphatidylserine decarboxylase [Bacillus mojavensis]MEC1660778.1 phosphatidylserine decarboxylase [Bacillus mojavensis]MEC1685496.1 phosphatidylserine decarboxylase [Bacillus mojavensis]MEC1708273.1 phosphatidylserine decarboxylase [Bacillus mojavensis]MEC1732591.1 phosphatidylserine decarboxylase [Bacillus mojavensis]
MFNTAVKILYRSLIELTNHRLSSCLIKGFCESKISKPVIPLFSKHFQINWNDVDGTAADYGSLSELFIRNINLERRPVSNEPHAVVSPVDGVVQTIGTINHNQTFTVKGKDYSFAELTGCKSADHQYNGGYFVVLYLSPRHYHRFHSPISCTYQKLAELGNRSYPVNQFGLKYGKDVLSKNYRVVYGLNSGNRNVLMIPVGAMNINSIVQTSTGDQLKIGEELGYFSFGSTVILIFEKDAFQPSADLTEGQEVQVGQLIGYGE